MSYIRSYIIQSTDVVLHHTSVTFDAHLSEILGTTIMGGQIILLQPDGHFDMEVFAETINSHQVTYIGTVPSQLNELITYLRSTNNKNILKTLHTISSGGKGCCYKVILFSKILTLFYTTRRNFVHSNCH